MFQPPQHKYSNTTYGPGSFEFRMSGGNRLHYFGAGPTNDGGGIATTVGPTVSTSFTNQWTHIVIRYRNISSENIKCG